MVINMKKIVSYEKMSKKARKEFNDLKRGDWGNINPVTRMTRNKKKAYDRRAFKNFDAA